MSQIRIDVTPEQMLRIKVLAEVVGKTLGDEIALERFKEMGAEGCGPN